MRFYTLPPTGIHWPFLLVNPRNWRVLLRRKFEHAILDCGVEFFAHNPTAREYPDGFIEKWVDLAKYVSRIFGPRKVWVTIPDYPDDYHPGQFEDNVGKTYENITNLIDVEGVSWLPSLQARFLDRFSFSASIQRMKDFHIERLGIGTVCKTSNLAFIQDCLRQARVHFPTAYIHAFGLTLRALPRVRSDINSFDSLAYTYPLTGKNVGYNGIKGMACTHAEKTLYFSKYTQRIEELTNPPLGAVQ